MKTARIQYQADKTVWEKKWEAAKVKHQADLENQEQMRQMVKVLVDEALRYVELGGRLIVPWSTRKKRGTPAETWHLRTFEEFNRRAKPMQEHRTDKKDADGNLTGWSIQYENQNGGETMAGGEQANLMIQWLGKYAREGDETALRWLHSLSLLASKLFWLAVEQQPDRVEKVSKEWTHVPFATNGTAANAKQAKIKVEMLAMPTPPDFDLKVDPTSRHHELINRISDAVNFLMQTPPVCNPWTGADESAPEWGKAAWEASQSQPQKLDLLHQVYWKIYEAAMTRTPESPWAKHSRPRKEKEKFMNALKARTKGYGQIETP